jgi:hypothetical protein
VGAFAPFADAAWIDSLDKARELEDPTSKTMAALMAGRWRRCDVSILAASVGNAYVLPAQGQAPTTVAFPAAQVVAANDVIYQPDSEVLPVDGSQYGMSVAKMIHAKLLLDESELEGPRHLALSSFQLGDLLRRTPVTSTFYAEVKALNKGEISEFMGFTVHRLQSARFKQAGLTVAGHTAGYSLYQCVAWIENAIVYRGRTIDNANIWRRPDKSNRIQAFYEMEDGAVRRYDTAVVRIDCDTSPAY